MESLPMGCAYEQSCVVCEDAKVKFRFGKITNVWLSETFVCRVRVLVKDGTRKHQFFGLLVLF
jgi:hypothetical protein